MAGLSEKQLRYKEAYESGMTMKQVGDLYGVSDSAVCKVLQRVYSLRCPFSANCLRCPLPECAIKDEYAHLVNCFDDKRACDKRKCRIQYKYRRQHE